MPQEPVVQREIAPVAADARSDERPVAVDRFAELRDRRSVVRLQGRDLRIERLEDACDVASQLLGRRAGVGGGGEERLVITETAQRAAG